jgi:hypothetical protein
MKHIDTDPYSVTTRKNGCEVWVTNENWNLFIGELTNELRYPDQTTDVDNKTIADVMRKAQVICNALNENQMEQM